MNTKLLIPALLTSGLTFAAVPGVNLERVNKDMTIMGQIIATALEEADLCRDCSDEVSARYLAKQGVVFTIQSTQSLVRYITRMDGVPDAPDVPPAPDAFEFEFGSGDLADIPMIVNDALSHINIDIEGDGEYFSLGMRPYLDSGTRDELRELARDRRRLEIDRRELEIERIHVEEEERQDLDERLTKLQTELAALEKNQERLDAIRQEKLAVYQKERAEERKAREAKRAERLAKVEDALFEAICDYGSTLKNIPDDEHVSLVMESGGLFDKEKQAKIFVLSKRDVNNCQLGETGKLKGKAIVYQL